MKYGVFGGTFDPPHRGHLAIAEAARTHLELDEVLIVPNNRNPLKARRSVAKGDQRMEMAQLLVQDLPGYAVSDMEITRRGESFTIDTMDELAMVRPGEYWFIMGADGVLSLKDWKGLPRLARLTRFAIIARPPYDAALILEKVPPVLEGRVDVVPMEPIAVSSTEVRDRLARARNADDLLTPAVSRYIKANGLYRT
ncbi:MAG: nicotinate-nucleotide adenylyltransferase [Fimbriimonadaceae bacterium]|nr:nicotinate-nucleotide adenylyltransferase [Fimbriimonadaceae bacterium]